MQREGAGDGRQRVRRRRTPRDALGRRAGRPPAHGGERTPLPLRRPPARNPPSGREEGVGLAVYRLLSFLVDNNRPCAARVCRRVPTGNDDGAARAALACVYFYRRILGPC